MGQRNIKTGGHFDFQTWGPAPLFTAATLYSLSFLFKMFLLSFFNPSLADQDSFFKPLIFDLKATGRGFLPLLSHLSRRQLIGWRLLGSDLGSLLLLLLLSSAADQFHPPCCPEPLQPLNTSPSLYFCCFFWLRAGLAFGSLWET